jgi:hypothetical protein
MDRLGIAFFAKTERKDEARQTIDSLALGPVRPWHVFGVHRGRQDIRL